MGGRKLAEIRFIDREAEVALSYQIRMAAMAGHRRARLEKTRRLALASLPATRIHRNTARQG